MMIALLLAAALAGSLELAPAAGLQHKPVCTGGEEEGFIVWRDGRALMPDREQVFGSRIDASGRLLDEAGIPVSDPEIAITSLHVVRMGADYVVVWTENTFTLHARRIRSDGTFIDEKPVLLESRIGLRYVDVASNGETLAVSGSWGLMLYDAQLRMLTYVEVRNMRDFTFVASDGTAYLAGGSYLDAIHAAFVSADGEVVSERVIARSDVVPRTRAIWTGREYFLLWADGTRLVGRTLDGPLETFDEQRAHEDEAIVTSSGKGDAVVVFEQDGDLRASHYRGASFDIANDATGPAAAFIDEQFVTAWDGINTSLGTPGEETRSAPAQRHLSANARIMVWEEQRGDDARIMAGIAGRAPFAVTPGEVAQRSPAVASTGDLHLIVWYETGASTRVKALRVNDRGDPLDPEPFDLGEVHYAFESFDRHETGEAPPAVLWTGEAFLVAFASPDITLVRITAGGWMRTVFDTIPRSVIAPLRPPVTRPVLTGSGDDVFLLWQEGRMYGVQLVDAFVRLVPLNADGVPTLTFPYPLLVASGWPRGRPDAVWNGRELGLVVLRFQEGLFLQRLTRNGLTELTRLRWNVSELGYPTIAFDRGTYQIAWQDEKGKRYARLAVASPDDADRAITLDTHAHRPELWRDSRNRLLLGWESLATAAAPGVPRIVTAVRSDS